MKIAYLGCLSYLSIGAHNVSKLRHTVVVVLHIHRQFGESRHQQTALVLEHMSEHDREVRTLSTQAATHPGQLLRLQLHTHANQKLS
jgi:hypothetical protein